MATVYKIVLVRHGESQWNLENRFSGWHDADLSVKGVEEAKLAGKVDSQQNSPWKKKECREWLPKKYFFPKKKVWNKQWLKIIKIFIRFQKLELF